MPIPLMIPPGEDNSLKSHQSFQLVSHTEKGEAGHLMARAVAHCVDMMLVLGVSHYAAKTLSLWLVSLHMKEIRNSGKVAARLFQEAFGYGQTQMLSVAFLLLSLVYFVVLPSLGRNTLGLSLLGFRLEGEHGQTPGLKPLLLRFVGCALMYCTFGLLLLPALKRAPRALFHDRLSHTRLVPTRH